jgi:beta-glucanase (GH16 family)
MMMLLVTVCKILILMAITYSSSCHGKEKETSQWSRKDGTDEKANSPWIDPDTPDDVRTIFSYPVLNISEDTKRGFDLVFSDEFEVDGRTMNDGRDPRWTALHSDDLTNNPLHWYSHDAVTTHDGVLDIKLDVHPETFTYWQQAENVTREQESLNKTHHSVNVTKEFRSGMMQSWNKFCFTGGIIEMSAKLPGDSKTGGLWPASK